MSEIPDTMDRCLAAWAERTPDALAVAAGEVTWSHSALHRLACSWAAVLRTHGVGPGTAVGLHVERSHLTVLGIAAILEAGAAYVPLEPSYPQSRLQFIARDAGVQLIVTESARANVPILDVPTVCLDTPPPPVAATPVRRPSTADTAYITYTSGSTGTPKGVPMPHRGICRSLQWLQRAFPYRPDDRGLFKSPLGFDVSSRWEILWPLASGGATVIARPGGTHDPAYLAQLIIERSITVMHFVPSMLEVFLDEPGITRCRSLRRVFSGGEALSHALKQRFFQHLPDCELIDIYGATETVVVTYRQCRPSDPAHERPIGRPIPALPVYLLGTDLQAVTPGEAGEIHVGGDFLASGYLGLPELTAQRFIPHPPTLAGAADARSVLFKTGDWARELPSGQFEHLGRQDHQVKVRGVRVELGEVEAALEALSEVARAVVVARTHPQHGTRLIAYVRWHGTPGPNASLTHVRAHLQGRLPGPMVPAEFIALDEFPLTANGKIDRLALAASEDRNSPIADAATATEERVAAIWRTLLGVEQVGREQDFFAIGGDSLLAMRLLVHVRSEFQVAIPPRELVPGLTVAELARWLDAGQIPTRERDSLGVQELRAQVRLDGDVVASGLAPGLSPASDTSAHGVFLTGATGFLGAFLLADLLQHSDAPVYCLVRGEPDAARARLAHTCEHYGLHRAQTSARVRVVTGDLGAPRLGLSDQRFAQLGARITAIYHAGAQVNEATTYAALRAVNVAGTHEILRLASLGAPTPVHFISTTAVFESSGYLDAPVIADDAPLDDAREVYGGYAQSKWIAEALVMEARRRGLPAVIYRLGALSGDSRTGRQDWQQLLGCLLRGILAERAAPDMDLSLAMTPVDFASRAIVHLSRQDWAMNRDLNLVNPESVSLAQLVETARSLGHDIATQPYRTWLEAVSRAIVKDARHPLGTVFPLLSDTIPGTERSALEWYNLTARVQCGIAPQLARAGISCPAPDRELLTLYLRSAHQEIQQP